MVDMTVWACAEGRAGALKALEEKKQKALDCRDLFALRIAGSILLSGWDVIDHIKKSLSETKHLQSHYSARTIHGDYRRGTPTFQAVASFRRGVRLSAQKPLAKGMFRNLGRA